MTTVNFGRGKLENGEEGDFPSNYVGPLGAEGAAPEEEKSNSGHPESGGSVPVSPSGGGEVQAAAELVTEEGEEDYDDEEKYAFLTFELFLTQLGQWTLISWPCMIMKRKNRES